MDLIASPIAVALIEETITPESLISGGVRGLLMQLLAQPVTTLDGLRMPLAREHTCALLPFVQVQEQPLWHIDNALTPEEGD